MRVSLPSRLVPVALAAGLLVALSSATRLALALRADVALGGPAEVLQILLRGLMFDLSAAAYLLAVPVLWLALLPDRLARTWLHRALVLAWFAASAFGLLLLPVAEWLFWDEFGARFNFIAVDYLIYTREVLGNIWQNYPVGWVLGGIAALALALTALVARPLWRTGGAPLSWHTAGAGLAASALALGCVAGFVDSDAKSFSTRDAANELAGNGLYDFFAANRRNELDFERFYATLPLGEALARVRKGFPGADWIAPEAGGIERHVRAAGKERRMHVVLVTVESLGAEFLGAYGNADGLTPNLDRLARESLWFTNVYATGNRTVRGLEAVTLALPPTPGQSIVRRPNNDALFSLGSVFEDKGYGVLFAYGGYGYFDNMNAFFDANDYRAVDRRDIPSGRIAFENIWGVADEHLFDQVIDEFDRELAARPARPLFAHVMTTSNHQPFTYPEGRIDIPPGTGRGGAVKYSDFAIGRFLEKARARPWFADTLFVITADHGASARGSSQIPVERYRIPLLVYAPGLVAPARVDRLMSQIDIAPTLLGLLEFDYYSKFLGRDVLRAPPGTDRAFVANYQTLGFIRGGRIAVLEPKRRLRVFELDPQGHVGARASDPELEREAVAWYQVAAHAFRSGLYRDEEQVPPQARAAVAQRVAAHAVR
ncbi:MAG: LTA synthase family protein [Betaproteobacteria bacterium]|nr:LTA synthase family protein [Betaproteobacteria bacterium]MDH5221466.1 LTA synthase family protein [Betaproteobacteria bacterium]MDH5351125.1 LTA synthase family protein [Betaproteobacteria bacterium]